MVKRLEVVRFLDEYLKIRDIEDSSWNGLQFEGKDDVKKIVFAVDAGLETFKRAADMGADMVVLHHGQFWTKESPNLVRATKRRIDVLYKNNISVYAAHLPLDLHKEVGNNAQLLKIVGAKITKGFANYHGKDIGWIGELKTPLTPKELAAKYDKILSTRCKLLDFGSAKIKTIATCSGGAGYAILSEALRRRVDCYVTGDSVELYHACKDNGLNVIFAGHHASETVGVKALSEVVKKKFGVETVFLDIPTGL